MTAVIIIAAVIAVIVMFINIPACAYIRFYDGKPDIRVSYLFFKLFDNGDKSDRPEKSKKDKKGKAEKNKPKKKSSKKEDKPPVKSKEKSSETTEKSADKKQPEKEKNPFLEKANDFLDGLQEKKNSVQLLIELLTPPLKKLGKKVRIDDIKIDFAAASEDAAEAAVLYGKLNAAVYNAISAVRCFISISVISVNIDCLYNTPADKCRYNGECRIKLRPASLISAILSTLARYGKEKEKYSAVLTLINK